MALATRAQIDAAQDLKTEDVPVPEWGKDLEVRLRALTSAERSRIDATMVVAKGQSAEFRVESLGTLRERTVAAAMIDADGKRLYSDKEVLILGKKNSTVIQRLFDKVQEMSGMDKNALVRAEGNSEATQNEPSGSDS